MMINDGKQPSEGSTGTELLLDSLHPALKLRHTLRGHDNSILRMALSHNGRTLASFDRDKLQLWEVESGLWLGTLKHPESISLMAWSPDGQRLASCTSDGTIRIWDAMTGSLESVFTGYSSGKCIAWSPDGRRLCSGSWDNRLTLWDAALLLFDCSDAADPFRGVPYWAKVLKKHASVQAIKFLVSARCDVSPVTVDRATINQMLAQYGLDEYFRTSAYTGEGLEELFKRLLASIPWQELPLIGTPRQFQAVREFLLEKKGAGMTLIHLAEVGQASQERVAGSRFNPADLDGIIRLLQSRGLVFRLEPRPGETLVLLKPELVNQYGSSVIQAARNHPLGIGAVAERDVLLGNLSFTGFERLNRVEEALVLEATTELLISHDLCFREMGYLVFPSQIKVTKVLPSEAYPRTPVLGEHRNHLRFPCGAAELHGPLPA